MTLTSSTKALLISLSISVILLVLLLTSTIKKTDSNTDLSEEFDIEILTETPIEESTKKTNKTETNDAYNSNKASNRYTKAYDYIPPAEDFKHTKSTNSDIAIYSPKTKTKRSSKAEKLQKEAFLKANQVLNNQKSKAEENNKNSSVSFSLKNRTKVDLPIPVYLCDASGKIVINIKVNSNGNVVNASVNSSASNKNGCLQERALQYAKRAVFNSSNTPSQMGSITYVFL